MKQIISNELLNEVSDIVEAKRIAKNMRKARIAELVAQGIDKTLAVVMVDSFAKCGF